MQRLLIVDDETIICDGLYEILSREQIERLDIYKCYSAFEAMKLIEQYRFDILLTDIQMPGMTGLQLAELTRKKWPKCRVIFLTGHHEFDYVYKAISFERVSYILKTEGYDKVIETIKYAVQETTKLNELNKFIEDQQHQQQNSAKQLLLYELIYSDLPTGQMDELIFKQASMSIAANSKVLVLIGQYTQQKTQKTLADRVKLKYELLWIADHFFKDFEVNTEVYQNNNELVWLIQPQESLLWDEMYTVINSHLDTLQDLLQDRCNIDVSFILDHEATSFEQLTHRVGQLKMLFQYRYGRHDDQLIVSASEMNEEQQKLVLSYSSYMSQVAQLDKLLQQSQLIEFEKLLQDVLDNMYYAEQDNISEEIYLHTAIVLFAYINKWSLNDEIGRTITLKNLLYYKQHLTKIEAISYLKSVAKCILTIQLEAQDKRASSVIEKLQHYIGEQIFTPDKLTLVHLSEVYYFNTSYLSRLFKQVTGRNISDYIVEVKMMHAEKLLSDSQNKIQDVADKLGYSNATNFTRVFKKQFGKTPQEYRSMHSN